MSKKILFLLFLVIIFLLTGCKTSKEMNYGVIIEKSKPLTTDNQIDLFGDQSGQCIEFIGRNGEGWAFVNLFHCDENYIIYEDDNVMVVNKGTYDNPDFKMIKDNTEVFDFTYTLFPYRDLSNGDEVDFYFNDITKLSDLGYSLKDYHQNFVVEGLSEVIISPEEVNIEEVLEYANTFSPEPDINNLNFYSNFNIDSIYLAVAKKTTVTDTKSFIMFEYSYDAEHTGYGAEIIYGDIFENVKEICALKNPYNTKDGLKWDDSSVYSKDWMSGMDADYDFVQLY